MLNDRPEPGGRSTVLDDYDKVVYRDDIVGEYPDTCAVYIRGNDIAVVNVDKGTRVTLFKY